MEEPLLSIDDSTSVTKASKFMLENQVSGVLVMQDGKHAGIITDRDFTRKVLAEELDPSNTKVSAIMSKPLISLASDKSMDAAFMCMRKNHIRHLIITENDNVVGMLSVRDFANYYNNKYGKGKDPIAEFWNNYDALLIDNTFIFSVEKLLKDVRKELPNASKTAKSIDNKEPWIKIAEHAEEEGLEGLSEILGLAETD